MSALTAYRASKCMWRAVGLALFITVAGAVRAVACTCVCDQVRTTAEHVEKSSGIVVAKVVDVIDQTDVVMPNGERWSSSCGEAMLRLDVCEVLKGKLPPQLFVRHAAIGTGCDVKFQFQVGTTYLLFLGGDGENACPVLRGCSPSQPFAKDSRVLADTRAHLKRQRDIESK